MNISANDVILMAHATCGVLGTLAALWVFVEALNASEKNAARTRTAARLVAAFMAITAVVGGYWYVRFYPADRAMILVSHDANIIRTYCRSALILKAGRGRVFEDLELALRIYETL